MIKVSTYLSDDEENLDSRLFHAKPSELVEILLSQISSIRKTLLCNICAETLKRPHTLHCGHTFCGPCLVRWFPINKICPSCRIPVKSPPTISYTLEEQLYLLYTFDKAKHAKHKSCSEDTDIEAPISVHIADDFPSLQQKNLQRRNSLDKPDPFITGEVWDSIFSESEPLCSTRISEDITFNSTNTMGHFDIPPSSYLSFLRNSTLSSSSFAPSVISSFEQSEVNLDAISTEDPESHDLDLRMRWSQTNIELDTSANLKRYNRQTSINDDVLDWPLEHSSQTDQRGFPNINTESLDEPNENHLATQNSPGEDVNLDTTSHYANGDNSSISSRNPGPLNYLDNNLTKENPDGICCSSPIIQCISSRLEESFLHGASEIIPDGSSGNDIYLISQCPNCGWHLSDDDGELSNHSDVTAKKNNSRRIEEVQTIDSDSCSISSKDRSMFTRYQSFNERDDGAALLCIGRNFNSNQSKEIPPDRNNNMNRNDSEDTSYSSIYSNLEGNQDNENVSLVDRSSGLFSSMWDSALGQSDIQINPSFLEQAFLDSHESQSQNTLVYDSDNSESHVQRSMRSNYLLDSSNEST